MKRRYNFGTVIMRKKSFDIIAILFQSLETLRVTEGSIDMNINVER